MQCIPYYKAIGTHPDISFAISMLLQSLDNPALAHWKAVDCIFHYLSGMKNWGLAYRGGKEGLEGYTNVDSTSQDYRHAISGYTFIINSSSVS